MFGHQNDQPAPDEGTQIPDESIQNVMSDDGNAVPAPTFTDPAAAPAADNAWQHPGVPVDNTPEPISDVISPVGGFPRSTVSQANAHPSVVSVPAPAPLPGPPSFSSNDSSDSDNSGSSQDLIEIKQHALEELEPLIDELDQTPEERFRTIMMMIQASDDQDMVAKAYETAHSIEDEKARAQALLDIVNEINYFTTQHQS